MILKELTAITGLELEYLFDAGDILKGKNNIDPETWIRTIDNLRADLLPAARLIAKGNEDDIDKDKFMYVSFFSQYPGFFAYTTLEKGNSSYKYEFLQVPNLGPEELLSAAPFAHHACCLGICHSRGRARTGAVAATDDSTTLSRRADRRGHGLLRADARLHARGRRQGGSEDAAAGGELRAARQGRGRLRRAAGQARALGSRDAEVGPARADGADAQHG